MQTSMTNSKCCILIFENEKVGCFQFAIRWTYYIVLLISVWWTKYFRTQSFAAWQATENSKLFYWQFSFTMYMSCSEHLIFIFGIKEKAWLGNVCIKYIISYAQIQINFDSLKKIKAFGFPLSDEEANSVHDRICYVCIGILQWWVFAGIWLYFIFLGGGGRQ